MRLNSILWRIHRFVTHLWWIEPDFLRFDGDLMTPRLPGE